MRYNIPTAFWLTQSTNCRPERWMTILTIQICQDRQAPADTRRDQGEKFEDICKNSKPFSFKI